MANSFYTETERFNLVRDFKKCRPPLSLTEYCYNMGIPRSTFFGWQQQYKQKLAKAASKRIAKKS